MSTLGGYRIRTRTWGQHVVLLGCIPAGEGVRNHQVLVDGDTEGYVGNTFTGDLVGPIVVE